MALFGVIAKMPHEGVGRVGVANVKSAFGVCAMRRRLRDHRRLLPCGIRCWPFDQLAIRRLLPWWISHAVVAAWFDHQNSVPSVTMHVRITASLRATAMRAFLKPIRFASLMPHALRLENRLTTVSSTVVAS